MKGVTSFFATLFGGIFQKQGIGLTQNGQPMSPEQVEKLTQSLGDSAILGEAFQSATSDFLQTQGGEFSDKITKLEQSQKTTNEDLMKKITELTQSLEQANKNTAAMQTKLEDAIKQVAQDNKKSAELLTSKTEVPMANAQGDANSNNPASTTGAKQYNNGLSFFD